MGGTLRAVTVMGQPDKSGRFGEFGGQFVPESLMPACRSSTGPSARPGATRRSAPSSTTCCADYAGRPSPLTECHRLSAELGCRVLLKREDLNHTGSHKINNVLGQALLARAHGQDPAGRRDRRRPARRGHRHRGGAVGHGVPGVHGRGRHGPPGAERVPHAPARRRGHPGAVGQPDPQGCRERGHAGLGRHRRALPLLPRLGDGPASVSVDGPRVPPGARHGGPGAVRVAAGRRRARRGRGLRRRRVQRRRDLLGVRRATGGRAGRRRAGRWCGGRPRRARHRARHGSRT